MQPWKWNSLSQQNISMLVYLLKFAEPTHASSIRFQTQQLKRKFKRNFVASKTILRHRKCVRNKKILSWLDFLFREFKLDSLYPCCLSINKTLSDSNECSQVTFLKILKQLQIFIQNIWTRFLFQHIRLTKLKNKPHKNFCLHIWEIAHVGKFSAKSANIFRSQEKIRFRIRYLQTSKNIIFTAFSKCEFDCKINKCRNWFLICAAHCIRIQIKILINQFSSRGRKDAVEISNVC